MPQPSRDPQFAIETDAKNLVATWNKILRGKWLAPARSHSVREPLHSIAVQVYLIRM
jgi:hypothetical protein